MHLSRGGIALGGLFLASVLAVLGGVYGPGAWSQSPLPSGFSPLSASGYPMVATSPVAPSSSPSLSLEWLFSSPAWGSPLPWIGLGVVLLGLAAWGLYAVLCRLDAAHRRE